MSEPLVANRPKGVATSWLEHRAQVIGEQEWSIEKKLEELLDLTRDPDKGTGHARLDREGLAHWVRHRSSDPSLDLDPEQLDTIEDAFKRHVRPFMMSDGPEERDQVALSLPWFFRPEQIFRDGLRTGCASTASSFVVLARLAGLHALLDIAVDSGDFLRADLVPGEPRPDYVDLDGHQTVLVAQDSGLWALLDTVRSTIHWGTDIEGRKLELVHPVDLVNRWVMFPGNDTEYVVRAVEGGYHDLLMIRNYNTAANTKVSGRWHSKIASPFPDRS